MRSKFSIQHLYSCHLMNSFDIVDQFFLQKIILLLVYINPCLDKEETLICS